MNKSTFIAFVAGAAIGSVTAWIYAKKKYEQLAQEEIESVREFYSGKNARGENSEKHSEPESKPSNDIRPSNEKPDVVAYAAKLKNEGYHDYSAQSEKKPTSGARPYVISPDEFGEIEEYTKISLTFYADQILCDDLDEPVENVEETVGFDSLNHFGEYEDDSVFVRNDARKCDYEILRSLRRYDEILKEYPYKAGI